MLGKVAKGKLGLIISYLVCGLKFEMERERFGIVCGLNYELTNVVELRESS